MTDSTIRGTHWSLTINNPTSADEECMALARQRGWKIDGQKERGEGGTDHYQLHLQTPQVRFSAVKKMFPRAHIEQARNPSALASYVTKEATRVGELPVGQDRYPSQSKFFELLWVEILDCPQDYNFRPETRKFYGESKPHKLAYWKASQRLVRQGYYVENMAVNPMTIAAWDSFFYALLDRKIAGETSRQPDTPALESQVSLPTVEHNHASQDVSQEAHQSPPQTRCQDPLAHLSGYPHPSCPHL